MRTGNCHKSHMYSVSYVTSFVGGHPPAYPVWQGRLLPRFLLSLSGRLWRIICFKVILLTVFALTTGFFFGATWTILEFDDLEAEEAAVEFTFKEAKI